MNPPPHPRRPLRGAATARVFASAFRGAAACCSGTVPALKYGGVDLRLGLQINELIGIYVQPQLGFYAGEFGGVTGVGGLLGGSILADFTFADRLFAAAGAGFALLNNPSGPEIHLRAGGYPLASSGGENGRRKGLMLGVDVRMHFVSGSTFFAPTLCIGYESF